MKKVIIERPRVGGGFCKPPQLYIDPKRVDEDFDAGPGRESLTKKMGWDMKSQTDVLGPLKKFLQSNLGRRWDDVWSEICEHNKDWMGDHLKRHVGYMVETDVRITEQRDLTDNAGFHFDGFYVDPETGKLEKKERQRWRYKPRPQTIFHLNGTDYYKYDGIWYRVVVKEWKREPADRYARHYHANDVFGNGGFDYHNGWSLERRLINAYGKLVYCTSKQQANSKECKLLNDMAEKAAKGKRAA
jgi:hypothetical protein